MSQLKQYFQEKKHFYSPKISSCISVQCFGPLSIHFAQIPTHGFSGTQMSLISFQPDHSFHENLVKCIAGRPQIGSEMADPGGAIDIVARVVIPRVLMQVQQWHERPQHWAFYDHVWTRIGKIIRDVD